MVRVLACHHFQGQRIGQCEEAVGVTLAEDVIIIALENKVNIYSALKTQDLQKWFSERRQSLEFVSGDIGKVFSFNTKVDAPTETPSDSHDDMGNELVLFHSFAPVDTIKTITYNERGHYLLTLEKPDIGVANTQALSARTYFQWDIKTDGKPMRARVAGLVSPTGGELGEASLKMIEIPPVPLFGTRAVASCSLTGNIACLSSDSRVNIYSFKLKGGSGRNKTQYADFDLICTVQLSGPNFTPQQISFSLDFVACLDVNQTLVFRVVSNEASNPNPDGKKKPGFDLFNSQSQTTKGNARESQHSHYTHTSIGTNGHHHSHPGMEDVVVFDPKVDSVKVYLRTVSKLNRKTKQPNLGFLEEFQEDITLNKSSVVPTHPTLHGGFGVEDLLRISASGGDTAGNELRQLELHPVRIKSSVGGVCCAIATSKELLLYNLPMKKHLFVTRVSCHPFTSNLISFSFGDAMFLHAITESGLETYTMRKLFYPLKEVEGFQLYENDCPLQDETPVLVGIRPFVGVRFMSANKKSMCLLSSPTPADSSTAVSSEESRWTMYSLSLPSMESLYQDIMKAAKLHQQSSPEFYFILLCELHILLRLTMNEYPWSVKTCRNKYLETCRLIGFEYFRKSTKEHTQQQTPGLGSQNFIDKGVTYLLLAGCDLQFLFAPENVGMTKDPALIPGIVRFIQISLPTASIDSETRLSPSMTKLIVEFLSNHSSEVLVDLVLEVGWLRECNSKRLVELLTPLAETQKYRTEESLALILSLVARHGEDSTGKKLIKEVLSKCQTHELESRFQLSWLLCHRNKQYSVSDLTVCLSAADSQVHINVLSGALQNYEISLSDVVLAFAQGVNFNSDAEIQQGLSKSLSGILEHYFSKKLKLQWKGTTPECTPDEIRALQTLIRTYLKNISANVTSPSAKSPQTDSVTSNGEIGDVSILDTLVEEGDVSEEFDGHKWQLFGKIPSFITHIVPNLIHDGKCQIPKSTLFSSAESKESFIKLTSLLGSKLCKVDGVKSFVLSSLHEKVHNIDARLHVTLELLCESCESGIDLAMARYSTILMLYAKETFGKQTHCWKTLVTKLKEKIKENSTGAESFAIIIESVYLHVANILSPSELEEVLDKEEENAKFYAACRRVELANTINEKVIQLSTAYLDQAK